MLKAVIITVKVYQAHLAKAKDAPGEGWGKLGTSLQGSSPSAVNRTDIIPLAEL